MHYIKFCNSAALIKCRVYTLLLLQTDPSLSYTRMRMIFLHIIFSRILILSMTGMQVISKLIPDFMYDTNNVFATGDILY